MVTNQVTTANRLCNFEVTHLASEQEEMERYVLFSCLVLGCFIAATQGGPIHASCELTWLVITNNYYHIIGNG